LYILVTIRIFGARILEIRSQKVYRQELSDSM
jgi:hypothetical protein